MSPRTHEPDCLCVDCMMADMDRALIAQGLDPAKYAVSASEMRVGAERTRYAEPGAGSGNGVVRKVSDKQVRFMEMLFATRDTSKLTRLPGSEDFRNMSLRGARDLIDRLLGCPELPEAKRAEPPASDKQKNFASSLRKRKNAKLLDKDPESMTRQEVSKEIDYLLALPDAPKLAQLELEAAIYLYEGEVVKVQRAVHGSGNMYAKVLNPDIGKFEYAPGMINKLHPEHRMTLEQAKEYGAVYGVCCSCGATLTDEQSIEAGMGRVCRGKFIG